ncbi:ribonuclease HII [Subsaximicrobium wynnwilliamsii]|uniref:Ribonuclease HII n=1 Tax=Subsaximicrobium wynnwilliamsii TaxID=291179 RepID=A0A5C6ZK62_9FLAO|nr:DUF3352 domain-containing protein [Subsaximicrobium wynnwilliamsii]TXD85359.1 ribonuclease HII [Subsaximicrobium wynnwilliamsii]TXD90711.1 ribonuclease HII [Subsaximicrobium wynnwilliamsii]TXE05219.1 ribonuclease HII [Subsaximicrobium wynnwilliamsii]
MRTYWLPLLCLLLLFSCKDDRSSNATLLSKIPENAEIVLKANNLDGFKSVIQNNQLLKELKTLATFQDLEQQLKPLEYINTANPVYIALAKDDNDSLEISVITKYDPQIIQFDSVPNIMVERFESKDESVQKISLNNTIYYSAYKDSILFLSNRLYLVEQSFDTKPIASELQRIYETSNSEKSVSVLINHKRFVQNLFISTNAHFNAQQFTNYSLLDADISQNDIIINGITTARDSSKSLINIFKGSIPQEHLMPTVLPSSTQGFSSFTTDQIKKLKTNLQLFKNTDSIVEMDRLFDNVIEFGQAEIENTSVFLMRSIDPSITIEELASQDVSSSYRTVDIYSHNAPEALFSTFSPLVPNLRTSYFINLDDFFIFAESSATLENIIADYQNGNILAEDEPYKDMMKHLSDESSLLFYGNSKKLQAILEENIAGATDLNLDAYKTAAIQYIYDSDFAHVNAILETHKSRGASKSVSETVNVTIDANLSAAPQLAKNHTNNQMDVAIQDINNNLYLISNTGKVFWKKQLSGKILGKIEQIDMYKNGRLQLAFATANRVYVLDRDGKDVAPFPLKFNDEITQPLSVFDYDNKRNYRLVVTQNKALLMYDQLGQAVTGFNFSPANNSISSQPKHFRVGRKDYIVFTEGDHLEILDRVGKPRIKVKEKISFSGNEVYLYNDHFTTTNTSGELLEVNQNGRVKHENLNLNANHKIATTSKTLAAISDNNLTIKSKTIALDFGNYTEPSIFYIDDKIYVSITDLQAKKVYLFDSQAKPTANFPIYGNSKIELANMDGDSNLEVLTKGSDNSVIIYKIN